MIFALFATDGSGRWTMAVPLPNAPVLTGLRAAFQAAVATGPDIARLETTAATILVMGM